MKRYILHIIILFVGAFFADDACGQTNISGTWAGGALTGSYILTGNTKLTGQISVSSATLTIDLNGYTLDRENKGFVAIVSESRTLVIKDSRGGGVIKNGRGDRGGCMLISGIVRFQGGEIRDCIATDGSYGDAPNKTNPDIDYLTQGCGGAFFVNSGATLEMSGNAKITNCKTEDRDGTFGRGGAVWVAGTFRMSGGTISGCEATYGGAVFVHGGYKNTYAYGNDNRLGTFEMTGGTIQNCRSFSHGCGIYTYGNVNISGDSKIISNRPLNWSALSLIDGQYPKVQKDGGYGGALYAEGENAKVTMTGGEFKNNLAESGGAVMLWHDSEMTMKGGTMESNYAMGKPSLGNGGALYLQRATFNFQGGTLKNNVANRYGGAINTNQGATLNISGNCIITGNRASHGGGISQEAGECSLTLNGAGIQITNNEAHGHQVSISDAGVHSVNNNVLGNGGGLFIEKGTVTMIGAKIKGNKASGHGGGASLYVNRIHGRNSKVTINGGEISENTAQYGGGIDVYANYQSLEDTYDSNDPYTGMSTLTVDFQAGTLSGNRATANGAGIYVGFNETYSTASMTIGTNNSVPIIKDNIADGNGGGFGMTNNGVITVNNMNASGNQANIGGAIWLGTGTFTLNNGTMTNNQVSEDGGGIYVGSGTFTIGNTVTLKGNSATNGNGGGIYLGGGNFTVQGTGVLNLGGDATDEGNSAGKNGGAIYCYAPFTVNDNGRLVMKNNRSNGDGGAVYCDAAFNVGRNGILTMEKNSAGKSGGAVYCNAAFTVGSESTIKNNSAVGNGGAVFVNGKDISLQKSEITSNSADNGGALYVNGGSIKINEISNISNNNAINNGGAAFVKNGTITLIKDASMSRNSATNGSGGVFYVTKSPEYTGVVGVTTQTGTMSSNTASNGSGGVFFVDGGNIGLGGKTAMNQNQAKNGGAIALQGGVFTINPESLITHNTATGDGGGLWVNNTTGNAIECLGGSFDYNTAGGNGGGLYAAGNFDFHFAANLQDNQAVNGGGIYLDDGIRMTFGISPEDTENESIKDNGLIVRNIAKPTENVRSSDIVGTGGGIYLNEGSLKFLNTESLGVYNNEASYEAADIYSSGTSTELTLPNVSKMNLTGFDVAGSILYWIKDFYNERYQVALKNMDKDIFGMVVHIQSENANEIPEKSFTEKMCLDLGYDMVFLELDTEGLYEGDVVTLSMYYDKNKGKGTRDWQLYRKALLHGKQSKTSSSRSGNNTSVVKVGLPTGDWKFEASSYDSEYTRISYQGYKRNGDEVQPKGDPNIYEIAKPQTIKLYVIYTPKEDEDVINTPQFYKVNTMIPKQTTSSL